MTLKPHRILLASVGLLLTLLASGCGNTCSVTGQVTYENEPVKDGNITFAPADGKGPIAGAKIKDGRYSVADMLPGPKIVSIIGTKDVPFARSTEEMAKMAAEGKRKGDATGLIDPADTIAPDAEGNNITIELAPGNHTRDFHVTKKK